MVQKSQEADPSSSQFPEEHEQPEAIKKAHEELQRTIQQLRTNEVAYLKFLYDEEQPRLRRRASLETDPVARQKAREELQEVESRLGRLGYKLTEPDSDEWEQQASQNADERLLRLLDEWLIDESATTKPPGPN